MAWELRLIIYSLVGFCCAAALSIGAWMCSCVCVCVCVWECMSILPLPSSQQEPGFLKKTHNIKRWWDLLCVCECKSQSLVYCKAMNIPAGTYVGERHICVRVFPCASLCLCMCLCGLLLHDSHGSVIPLITTAAWRNRLPFSAAVTEKRSQVDKPHQQI